MFPDGDSAIVVQRWRADAAASQAIRMVREGKVASRQGTDVGMRADTVCIHGDGPHALEFARTIRASLQQAVISVRAVGDV
jgi:UPF0271 protein